MPVGALLAPILAEAILPEAVLGTALGTAATGAIGAGLGAGSGALFSEITGGNPGAGALTGAIGGAAAPLGGALGSAAGIGSTAGSIAGGALGGVAGAEITGGNPLLGGLEGAAGPAIGAATGFSGTSATPSATPAVDVPPTGIGGGGGSAAAVAGGAAPGTINPDLSGAGVAPGSQSFLGAISDAQQGGDGAAPISGQPSASGGGPISGTGVTRVDPGTDLGGTWSSSDPAGGSNPFSSLISKFTDNPASLLMAAPLAMQLFGGGQAQTGGEKQLQTLAANMNSQGQALAAPMQTGTLPPGAQSFVTADTNAAKAHVRSAYAAAGLSGSTAEAEALSAADERAAAEKFSFASDLLGKGLAAQGSTGNYYSELARMQMSRDQQFSNALSTFARGLASGGGGNYNWNQSQSG